MANELSLPCRCASSCHSLTLTLDGALIASGHFDGSLRFWDMRSGRLAREVKQLHDQQICSVAGGLLGSAHYLDSIHTKSA